MFFVKRFDRYFLWVFLQSLLLVLALFVTVFLVVDVLLNLDKIQAFPDVARGAALFYAFNLPPILYLLYPLMLFTAGMFTVARLLRSRELLLLEAAGISNRRALAAVMIPVLLLGGCGLALRQSALPELAQAARQSPYGAFEYRQGRRITVRDDDGHVWFVRRYNLNERSLTDVRILHADGTRLVVAHELRWMTDQRAWWAPIVAKEHNLAALIDVDSPEETGPRDFLGALPFGALLPADMARRGRGYGDRTLTELASDAASARDDELSVKLWHELWHPWTGFILLSCGVGLILSRSGRSIFMNGSLALGAVVGFHVLGFWFETLAQSGLWPPLVGASLAPIGFAIFGVVAYART
jgi:lipopolysaccharide export LptBFGC system permease protein LptF